LEENKRGKNRREAIGKRREAITPDIRWEAKGNNIRERKRDIPIFALTVR
jgi:hypothetical protein